MNGLLVKYCVCLLLLAAVAPLAAAEPTTAELDFFEAEIRPVLVKHCYECHSRDAKNIRGGLLLDTRAGIRQGGESGPAIVPGKPEEGELLASLRYETFEMPPRGKLNEKTIAAFEQWIRSGAADPREGEAKVAAAPKIDIAAARQRWAFQKPQRHPAPAVRQNAWPRTDVDQFILAKLEAAQATPSADAEPAVLLRRLYYDLIGLPPTSTELQAFLANPSPQAWEATVDRLLQSPHFGERWGRHWLDVARYADSVGGGRTRTLDEAWRYRDYVIQAMHQDKPFDQFIVEQLAGDLLPAATNAARAEQLTATGFLVLGPTTYELQDKERLRMDVIDEQIDTMSRAFLGMTTGCARCHDHKFDPIPTRDYYALAGVFRSTKTLTPGSVSGFVTRELPQSEDAALAWKNHQAAQKKIDDAYAHARQDVKDQDAVLKALVAGDSPDDSKTVAAGAVPLASLPGLVVDETDAELTGAWAASQGAFPYVGREYRYSSRGRSQARYRAPIAAAGLYEIRLSYSPHANRAKNAKVVVHHAGGESESRIDQSQPGAIDGLFVSLGQFELAPDSQHAVVLECQDANGAVVADAVQFLAINDTTASADKATEQDGSEETVEKPNDASESDKKKRKAAVAAARTRLAQLEAEVARLKQEADDSKANAPAAPVKVMGVQEEEQTGDYYVCIRGEARNLGEAAPRGFLTALSDSEEPPVIPPNASGRLEVARWIASGQNPLTARVIVNRVWRHLFGAGIVRSTDNFGAMGEAPSHPDLLDTLAVKLVDDLDWSLKRLIRELVLSRTYQLSSTASAELLKIDPENRLLGRAEQRRMDAEAIRDYLLVVSGQLDLTPGGRSFPPGTSEFGYQFKSVRRSVYVPVFRNTLHELFDVFDFADPSLVSGDRTVSILPTQALFMMNSPFVMDQATAAAQRLLSEPGNAQERLERFYQQALGRSPAENEKRLSLAYVAAAGDDPAAQQEAWSGVCQAVFASLDFRYIR
ncbi:DUF1553 domain-containing protein [Lignipirellula cremea]|uniref:Xanthan lyase n=1 Tax=Lignipirellula cremea TaxID=2528010 RepID=A0A518E172_9BACT|nr:DUF1553 domain-containing protein [Lignipirellula cremea]QDU97838.1 Xanthan lyase precursor [Lignipirellula cremea]